MSRGATANLRTLAFGELDCASWGAVWNPGGGGEVMISLGAGTEVATARVTIAGSSEREQWRLAGKGVDLVVSGEREAAQARSDGACVGFDQLCRVSGRFAVGGEERVVDCPGRRGLRTAVDLDRCDSARDVSAWFGPDEGLALVSIRPRGSTGHERDLVTAAAFDALRSVPVADPRLSTTYAAAGRPVRASLELWLEDEQSELYPQRTAGDSIGPGVDRLEGGFELHTTPIRWRGAGREGTGIYMLARSR
ncbi:MAG: hypothetical protein ACR2OB_10860 [Solirubrobacteraceae bacterium]